MQTYEAVENWSLSNLRQDSGLGVERELRVRYPDLNVRPYERERLDLDRALADADCVIVHEWNEPWLVSAVGEHRRTRGKYLLLFHDTHHRMVTAPEEMGRFALGHYDGVLAFGEVLRELYLKRGISRHVYAWHEAADVEVFWPRPQAREADLAWVGNWGDGERERELEEFLLDPILRAGISANIYGVRYPSHALSELRRVGARYRGFVPNFKVPEVFGAHAVTVHVPRRPYVEALVGVPTIRMFEALACGIPLVSSPWCDREGLFTEGKDYLLVKSGADMTAALKSILHEPMLARELSAHGRDTILRRHTCAHRVDELMLICRQMGLTGTTAARAEPRARVSTGESA